MAVYFKSLVKFKSEICIECDSQLTFYYDQQVQHKTVDIFVTWCMNSDAHVDRMRGVV